MDLHLQVPLQLLSEPQLAWEEDSRTITTCELDLTDASSWQGMTLQTCSVPCPFGQFTRKNEHLPLERDFKTWKQITVFISYEVHLACVMGKLLQSHSYFVKL